MQHQGNGSHPQKTQAHESEPPLARLYKLPVLPDGRQPPRGERQGGNTAQKEKAHSIEEETGGCFFQPCACLQHSLIPKQLIGLLSLAHFVFILHTACPFSPQVKIFFKIPSNSAFFQKACYIGSTYEGDSCGTEGGKST